MKVLPVLGVALLQLLAAQYAAANNLFVQFNRELMSTESQDPAGNRTISFMSLDPTQLSSVSNMLEATNADSDDSDDSKRIACSTTDDAEVLSTKVNVLVLISKCFKDDSLMVIDEWINALKSQNAMYFEGNKASAIEYVKQIVPTSSCTDASITFGKLPGNYIAAIQFATGINMGGPNGDGSDLNSYTKNGKKIVNIPNKSDININLTGKKSIIRFQMCDKKDGCTPLTVVKNKDFTFIDCANELVNYNPYTVVRSFHCAKLDLGIPTTCCAWYEKKYLYEITAKEGEEECVIKDLANTGGGLSPDALPAPFPVDNYVDDNRDNEGYSSSPLSSARIELEQALTETKVCLRGTSSCPTDPQTTVTAPFTWKVFQKDPKSKINDLTFTEPGIYNIELKAIDYGTTQASCEGCLAVVDKRRPTAVDACPVNAVAADSALTKNNLAKVVENIEKAHKFKSSTINGVCNDDPDRRCDKDSSKLKPFQKDGYEAEASSLALTLGFFTSENVKSDLEAKLTASPFASDIKVTSLPVCKRCATLTTALKEWYTPYHCDKKGTKIDQICDGDAAATCSLEQCVIATGNTLASASASLTEAAIASLVSVLRALKNDQVTTDAAFVTNYGLTNTMNVALACTQFPPTTPKAAMLLGDEENVLTSTEVCTYTTTLGDLISKSATAKPGSVVDNLSGKVFWHYQVGVSSWTAWDDSMSLTFDKSSTTIAVEAWTSCGKVDAFTFTVNLHLNDDNKVCEHFKSMWYQTTVAPELVAPSAFCMHPKSDFAEATFDYHPDIGLQYDASRFLLTISSVTCYLKYLDPQFAIDGVHLATTKPATTFSVTCDFTYTPASGKADVTQQCTQDFKIKDCSPPVISRPCELDGKCDFRKCASDSTTANPFEKPDLYQACGGNRIRATATETLIDTADTVATCCDSCTGSEYTTKCVPLLGLPEDATSTDIKRCEAVLKKPTLMATLMLLSNSFDDQGYSDESEKEAADALDRSLSLLDEQRGAAARLSPSLRRICFWQHKKNKLTCDYQSHLASINLQTNQLAMRIAIAGIGSFAKYFVEGFPSASRVVPSSTRHHTDPGHVFALNLKERIMTIPGNETDHPDGNLVNTSKFFGTS
ncbi:hypothetical protein FI667_g17634, partial [Globisporangium splendens]